MPTLNILAVSQTIITVITVRIIKDRIDSPRIPEKNEYCVAAGAKNIIRNIIVVGAKNGMKDRARDRVEYGSWTI